MSARVNELVARVLAHAVAVLFAGLDSVIFFADHPGLQLWSFCTMINEPVARNVGPDVTIWPGQTAVNALTVARYMSSSLYDVVGTQLHEGTEEYLHKMAQLAGLSDWVALARFADHIELDTVVEWYQEQNAQGGLQKPASDYEKFAFGVFRFLTDDDTDRAMALWEKCDLDVAKVAIAVHGKEPGPKLKALGDVSEPYSSFARDDLEALRQI